MIRHPLGSRCSLRGALAILLVLSVPCPARSQAPVAVDAPGTAAYEPPPAREHPFPLTIRNIMRGPELVGQSPSAVRWSDDSRWIYFRWLPGGNEWHARSELYRVPAGGGEPEQIPRESEDSVDVTLAGGELSPDGRRRVLASRGDVWLVDRRSGESRRLTETRAGAESPRFSPEGDRVLFRQDDDLFSIGLDGGGLRQLTDIRTGGPPRETPELEGQRAFLERQQEELFEHVRLQRAREEEAEAERTAREEASRPRPFHVPEGARLAGLEPSRDGRYVLVTATTPAQGTQSTLVPEWITTSGYTEEQNVRGKVGDAQGSSRVAFYRPDSGEVSWLDPRPAGHEGDVNPSTVAWNDAGTHALVAARARDNKDWWLWSLDASTGELTLLDHHRDEAWVGGPCSSCRGWIPDTDRVWYVSEETGYAHLYTVNADGTGKRPLTSGTWEVLGARIPEGERRFLVTTSESSPFDRHVGWLGFEGGAIEYVTSGQGSFDVTPSPDGQRLAVVHSRANRPGELFVAAARRGPDLEQVTVTPTEEWLTFPWIHPEIVHFTAEDGARVPARIYRPGDMGAEPNGAGVIFVHGAGYLQNVHNYWSSYSREYMFHHLLAASGYTVLDIDYRGSAGHGRDWRTAIYRWMGGKDLSDQVDGAAYLAAEEGVDPERIGIYGGSYGGFITLMALFTAGESFKSGAALRSVTDWAHYNHGYTSNILNLPHEDEEAYRRSSPIYFAENLRPDQHLLILHGMVDTNVHFSDVVRLTQRLIELGKENWEMAVYPMENHGFAAPSSWTDEYRRIFELFERTLSRPGCTENRGLCALPLVVAGTPEGG